MRSLEGKCAVVTGAAMGIGAAVAHRFAAEGAEVAILDLNTQAGAATAAAIEQAGGKAFVETCDVAQPEQVARAVDAVVERCGHISALVNCAGIFDGAEFLDIDYANWQRVVNVDLNGTFLVSQAVARNMAEHGGGAIVCIASIDGHVAEASYASYNASKAAVRLMVKTAAIDLGRHGIRINSVSPGYVDTGMFYYMTGPQMDYLRTNFERVPLGRMVRPEEIADGILFLCSDRATAVTGTDLMIDGGALANSYIAETVPEL